MRKFVEFVYQDQGELCFLLLQQRESLEVNAKVPKNCTKRK